MAPKMAKMSDPTTNPDYFDILIYNYSPLHTTVYILISFILLKNAIRTGNEPIGPIRNAISDRQGLLREGGAGAQEIIGKPLRIEINEEEIHREEEAGRTDHD